MSLIYDPEIVADVKQKEKKRNDRLTVIIIVTIIGVIAIAIAIYLLLRKRSSTSSSKPPAGAGIKSSTCITNSDCTTYSPYCNTTTHQCVQCLDDSACSGTIPRCNTSNNSCVQCLTASDCGTCFDCTNNTCKVTSIGNPNISNAYYSGPHTLFVSWDAVAYATSYIINFQDTNNPSATCVYNACKYEVSSSVTSANVPIGDAACTIGPNISFVSVTAVNPCGNTQSQYFLISGQGPGC